MSADNNVLSELRSPSILVIDDEPEMCTTLKSLLSREGYKVTTETGAAAALQLVNKYRFDLVICDVVMPDIGGLALLSQIGRDVPVVMITAYASIETARNAFKHGARDYLVKPVNYVELLALVRQTLSARDPSARKVDVGKLGETRSPAFHRVLREAMALAPTDMPVLVLGESGVGKELIADLIERNSQRSGRPYLKINCAAIPDTLLESELFGVEKGAFTGAGTARSGKFEEATGGTILLDEIGDMPLFLQAKILRVLQDFRVVRLGGTREIPCDVRVIASTNRDLAKMVDLGEFRGDLYHRLNGAPLVIPPLRHRLEDLQSLADRFADFFGEKYHKARYGISAEAHQILRRYRWPGNIRELKHVIERGVILSASGYVGQESLPDSVRNYVESFVTEENDLQSALSESRDAFTRRLITEALNETGGNRTLAAKRLGWTRKTLYNWMKRLGISHEFR